MHSDQLGGLGLTHLCTSQDAEVYRDALCAGLTPSRAGTTEWQGTVDGWSIYIGWDWIEYVDGAIAALRLVAPRTNFKLLDPRGYDTEQSAEEDILWPAIDQRRWQSSVRSALNGRRHTLCGIDRPPQKHQ